MVQDAMPRALRRSYALNVPLALRDVALLCAVVLVCAWFVGRAPLATGTRLALGSVDPLTIVDFERAETSDTGRGFRWTTGDSALLLAPQSDGAHTLRLTISTLPSVDVVPLTLQINAHTLRFAVQGGPARRYGLLVPPAWIAPSENIITIQNPTVRPPQDSGERALGVALFEVDWRGLAAPRWLVPAQIMALALALALFYAVLAAARLPGAARVLALGLCAAMLLAMRHSDTRFVYRWHAVVLTLALAAGCAGAALLLRRTPPGARLGVQAWLRAHWPAAAGYALVTAALLFPLLRVFGTQIIGAPGDASEYLWKLQWVRDALLDQHTSPMHTPVVFYPNGMELTISELTPAQTLLGLPLTWAFGAVASYNTLIVASFVLTGFFTYLLAVRLGAPRGAAFVAGLILAFCIRRWYHADGHFGMMASQWMMLAFYGWEGVLTRRRMWDGLVVGLGLALTCWATWHYGATFPLLLAVYTVIRLGLRQLPALLQMWRPVLLAGVVAVALVLPFAQPYAEARSQGETYQHNYSELTIYSVEPLAYVLPNPFHPLWGAWAKPLYRQNLGEQYVALGYSVLALALAGAWVARRRRTTYALLALIALGFVASLGPAIIDANKQELVRLPVSWVYYNVPVLDSIRSWGRMSIYVVLGCALLAALALGALPPRWYRAGVVVAAALVLVEYASVFTLADTSPRPVDAWLRTQPGSGAVIQLPNGLTGLSQYATLFTNKPTNQGTGKFIPLGYRQEERALKGFPKITALRVLQRWQTDYIIVVKKDIRRRAADWRATLAAQPLVRLVYEDRTYCVYRLQRWEIP